LVTKIEALRPFAALAGRLTLGAIMFAHGWEKVIPHGALYGFAHFVAHDLGLPYWLGYVSAFTEFFGGIALILGFLTPLVAIGTAINMCVAIVGVHLHHGLTGPKGFEFPLSLLVLSLMILADGAGWLSLDRILFRGR
jgi:putative oxidoreductase